MDVTFFQKKSENFREKIYELSASCGLLRQHGLLEFMELLTCAFIGLSLEPKGPKHKKE